MEVVGIGNQQNGSWELLEKFFEERAFGPIMQKCLFWNPKQALLACKTYCFGR